MPERDPLPIVVSRSIGAITRRYDDDAPIGAPSLRLHAALLRHAALAPFPQRSLPARSRLSSRAVRVAMGAAGRRRWVAVDTDPDHPRTKVVRFSSEGVAASDAATCAVTAAEQRWAADSGARDLDALQQAAEALVGRFDLELPHHPISYGTADVTITGGASTRDPDPRVPPHGADWRPVLRTDPASAVGLPISSLLAQVLVQFTIDYERLGANLHATVRVLRHIGDDGVPLATLVDEGVNGTGKSALERHGVVTVDPGSTTAARVVRLTPIGVRMRDAFVPLVAHVDGDWRARFGDDAVDALLTELVARRDTWLPVDDRGATPDDHAVVPLLASG